MTKTNTKELSFEQKAISTLIMGKEEYIQKLQDHVKLLGKKVNEINSKMELIALGEEVKFSFGTKNENGTWGYELRDASLEELEKEKERIIKLSEGKEGIIKGITHKVELMYETLKTQKSAKIFYDSLQKIHN